jgi:5,10-methylenetetrahydromethanopterin reductase
LHVRRVRATTAARGADFKVIAYVPVAVADDAAQARAWLRPLIARYLGALHGQSILADAGLDGARTQPFREALAAGRTAAELVTDELVDTFAIAGTPAQCRKALARWADAGLDAVVAVVPDRPDFANQLERLGREVSPAWRELRRHGVD